MCKSRVDVAHLAEQWQRSGTAQSGIISTPRLQSCCRLSIRLNVLHGGIFKMSSVEKGFVFFKIDVVTVCCWKYPDQYTEILRNPGNSERSVMNS